MGSGLDPWKLKERLGGDVMDGGTRWLGPGPGHSPRDRSLSVKISDQGRALVHSFAGDDFRRCADYLGLERESLSAPTTASRCREAVTEPDSRALAIWRQARPDGAIVRAYLVGRGIDIPVPPSLRQGVGLTLGRTPTPTMVAAVQAPDRRIIAVQQLRLTWNGRKAPVTVQRLATGKLYDGAVRLAAAGAVLGLAEGVETALAAMQLADVPCWASLGAERLSLVRLPDELRELHIFADADQAGERAAQRTAERHAARGVKATIHLPPEGFGDWADVAASTREAA